MHLPKRWADRFKSLLPGTAFRRFFALESASGIVLLGCTVLALGLANSEVASHYFGFWQTKALGLTLKYWVNDGLMALFFLTVGIEIKRELLEGELSSLKRAALPVAAAVGGMIVPATIYLMWNSGTAAAHGWAIPMATDIAFAAGVITLLGRRVPHSLKVFLLALAIVDDIGAVTVIAFFYSGAINFLYLIGGFFLLALLWAVKRTRALSLYLLVGAVIWFCFLKSGVHATIAGVLLAGVMPLALGKKLEETLHPYVAYGIMPVFALANAGAALASGPLLDPLGIGVIFGLAIGKPLGICLFSWLAIRARMASLPSEARWHQLLGVGFIAGIGFTMAIFIAELAFDDIQIVSHAKVAIMAGSLVSALAGVLLLSLRLKKR